MPVSLHRDSSSHDLLKRSRANSGKAGLEFRASSARCLEVGLIVNMPDSALKSTERQFLTLLESAAAGFLVRLSLFALPDVPRSDTGRRHVHSYYSGMDNFWERRFDGLIVTGTEPRASQLTDEPYWPGLTRVLEWAEENTPSAIWSCLAAHAAVLHLDGITRRKLDDKRFGLFPCAPVSHHPLTAGLPSRLVVPHSRWNDLAEKDLTGSGYRMLTRSQEAGVDAFVKQRKSLFVFFQGHPEYEANTLLLEYRRDVGRYLRGERATYPLQPRSYFDSTTAASMEAFEARAVSDRREDLLADFPTEASERTMPSPWRPAAARLYHNWLAYLGAQKELRLKQARKAAACADELIETRRFAAGD